jgi:hypothetical protein
MKKREEETFFKSKFANTCTPKWDSSLTEPPWCIACGAFV